MSQQSHLHLLLKEQPQRGPRRLHQTQSRPRPSSPSRLPRLQKKCVTKSAQRKWPPSRRVGNRTKRSTRSIYMRNLGRWAHSTQSYVKQQPRGVLIFTEAHILAEDTNHMLDLWSGAGCNAVRAPAKRKGGSLRAGGLAMGILRRLQSLSLRHLAKHPKQLQGLRSDGLSQCYLIDFDGFVLTVSF